MKFKKYPKKPKAKASLPTLERFLNRCKEVDKFNAELKRQRQKIDAAKKKIASLKQPSFR